MITRKGEPHQHAMLDVLFVSVDPIVDTGDRLRSYLTVFDRDITDLTGTPAQVNDALASLTLPRGGRPGRTRATTARLVGTGYTSDGRAHVVWPFGTPPVIYLYDPRMLTDIDESDQR